MKSVSCDSSYHANDSSSSSYSIVVTDSLSSSACENSSLSIISSTLSYED